MKIRLTKLAVRDVTARVEWLAARDADAAVSFRAELDRVFAFLCERPSAGRTTRIGGLRIAVRRWPLPPMVVYFERRADDLVVYRVRHAARRPIER